MHVPVQRAHIRKGAALLAALRCFAAFFAHVSGALLMPMLPSAFLQAEALGSMGMAELALTFYNQILTSDYILVKRIYGIMKTTELFLTV